MVDDVAVIVRRVPAAPPDQLRELADTLRDRQGSAVVVLGTASGEDKVLLVATVSKELTSRVQAGRLVKELASRVGGGGGGRPDFAQAGGRDVAKLDQTLQEAPDVVRDLLA